MFSLMSKLLSEAKIFVADTTNLRATKRKQETLLSQHYKVERIGRWATWKSDFKSLEIWFQELQWMVWQMEKRCNVKQLTVSGEPGDIQRKTIDSWKDRLSGIVYWRMTSGIWMKQEYSESPFPTTASGNRGKNVKRGGGQAMINYSIYCHCS